MHLESLSNGLGAQSMLLFLMACRREIPATVSITADTGWENDRVWSNGRKASSETYFNEVVAVIAKNYEFDARFVRSVDKDNVPLPHLRDTIWEIARSGNYKNLSIPMFGSRGGRNIQTCTDKKKIRACRQEARRMGASTNCNAQGIHSGEADRRVKGIYLRNDGKWSIYQTTVEETEKRPDGTKIKVQKPIKWQTH